jgi:hypothetical protein
MHLGAVEHLHGGKEGLKEAAPINLDEGGQQAAGEGNSARINPWRIQDHAKENASLGRLAA